MFAVRELCKCHSEKKTSNYLAVFMWKAFIREKKGEAEPKDTNLNESCWH